MKHIILDTNAVRYFYQIECCAGEGVRDKVMKKYYFDRQRYFQFLRTVSSINILASTYLELFFQAYRKGDPNLLFKYNQLTQQYKELYGIHICIITPDIPELKYDQAQLADDLSKGLIQTEKYISPRIEYEVQTMKNLFLVLIAAASDVVYADIQISEIVSGYVFGILCDKIYRKLNDLYNQYYFNKKIHMSLDDIDKEIDAILLESIRDSFLCMDLLMNLEHQGNAIKKENVLYTASSTSEYLREILQIGKKHTQDEFLLSLDRALNELRYEKDFAETEIKYFRYLLQNALYGGKTIIHKNDIVDYSIITSLNEKATLRSLEGTGKKEDLKLITFDKKMYEFSRKNNVMYDEDIYNHFLAEI